MHEIGSFVLGGAPGMREEAYTKLAQRISCLGVLLACGCGKEGRPTAPRKGLA